MSDYSWSCGLCGERVPAGTTHYCRCCGETPPSPCNTNPTLVPSEFDQIMAKLDEILRRLL